MRFVRAGGVCAAVVLLASLAVAQQPVSVTADDLVRIALDNNRDHLALKQSVIEAEALARQAGLRPFPTLEVEAAVGAMTGSQGEAEYSAAYFQTLERGGKREKRVAVAEKSIEVAKSRLLERERQLAFEVKTRVLAVQVQDLRLAIMKSSLETQQESYRLTTQRVGLGDAAPLEEQLLLSEVNRVVAQIAAAEAVRDAALAELRGVLGTPSFNAAVLGALRNTARELKLEELQSYALKHRPDLQGFQLLEEHAAVEVALAAAEAQRDLTASARYTRSRTSFDQFGLSDSGAPVPLRDTDNIVTFGLSIPLTSRERAQPAVDAAKARQSQQTLQREHLLRMIPVQVEAAYRRWVGAKNTAELLNRGVMEPTQRSLSIVREAYRLGQLRLLDVLNEQRRLTDLQLSLIDALADGARALSELEHAIGGNLP